MSEEINPKCPQKFHRYSVGKEDAPSNEDLNELSEAVTQQVKTSKKIDESNMRELGTPIDGFAMYEFVDEDGDVNVLYYPPQNGSFIWVFPKRICNALKPAEIKYTPGMLRPADRVIPQILEVEDRGVNIFTPLPRHRRIMKRISRMLHGIASRVYPE